MRQLDADGDEIIEDVSEAEGSSRDAGVGRSEEGFETLLQQVRLRQGVSTTLTLGSVL
jgi:hypothetical protein